MVDISEPSIQRTEPSDAGDWHNLFLGVCLGEYAPSSFFLKQPIIGLGGSASRGGVSLKRELASS